MEFENGRLFGLSQCNHMVPYKWKGVRVRKRLEDAMKTEKGPWAKEHRRPLEAGKSLQREPSPANTLT